MRTTPDPLFQSLQIGGLTLPNRVVMAPLTRSRAGQPGDVPTPLMAAYYAQRASAGLIVAEATNISEIATGYALTPGIYTPAQVVGWRQVTDAVRAAGGRMFLQLWHCGRVSHESLHRGRVPVAPSAIPCGECMPFVIGPDGKGTQAPATPPRALELDEIRGTVGDYVQATENALAAGFEGVEVHAANGYLLHQFLASNSNRREDAYGGSLENRTRLLFEVVEAVAGVAGSARTGVRISPLFSGHGMADEDPAATFARVADHLSVLGLAYLHVADTDVMRGAAPKMGTILDIIRRRYPGALMLNGAYDGERARADIGSGKGELVAFGRPFIANPDLPERLRRGGPFTEPDPATFYGGDARGYTDYPTLEG